MEIYDLKTMQQCSIDENTIVALGTFDGCHTGHMTVLMNAFYEAKRMGLKSVVYTFDSIPKNKAKSIMTLDEKIKMIRKTGIDYIAIDSFSEVCEKSGGEFFSDILIKKLRAKGASCGFNYRFGKNAACDTEKLQEMFGKAGGSVVICKEILYENQIVSSTLIRNLISSGNVEGVLSVAPPYTVFAKVIYGKQLGRKLGIPTINQELPKEKISLANGVYITECEIGEDVYPSITNVGVRPTVETNGAQNLETHIIGYDGNLYSSYIRVNFYKKIRNEQKFDSVYELKTQISSDIEKAREYFK